MTKNELARLTALIGKAKNNEQLDVIREAFNARMKELRAERKTGFLPGDTVSLTHRKFGGTIHGIVEKVKRTKAAVNIEGTTWNVPMEMLTKVGG